MPDTSSTNHKLKISLSEVSSIIELARLHRPIGIFLLLWPIYWGLWLAAGGIPKPGLLLIFTLGVIFMRSAGCIINDIADQRFDGSVERTKQRPLITGKVTSAQALFVFCLLCGLGLLLVLQLNWQTIALSFLALLLSIFYPFMKRITHFPQVILGLTWYIGILMTFTATLGTINLTGYLLYLTGILWAVIYDTFYAMVDREDDRKIGVKSTAIFFGNADKIVIAILQILMLTLLVLIGRLNVLHWPYYLGLGASILFFGYQQYLIKNRIPSRCFDAFINSHWVGMSIFVGIFFSFMVK
ncbi:MAG: 4-hydroxybenzoate octaprenyltransferase [Legionellales bacterium]|nr:4-hydroxybenzoate octaprenyltransferase [Legionellales bacterium]